MRSGSGSGERAGLEQRGQLAEELGVVAVALDPGLLDVGEQLTDRVDHLQQRAGAVVGQLDEAVTQPAEQVLTDMGQLLEAMERQEATGALDRMNGPEHPGQQFSGTGILLKCQQVSVQLVEILVTLDQELGHDLVDRFHSVASSSTRTGYASASAGAT